MKRTPVVWLNGRFMSEPRARVPATLALVTHGLGVFESLRIVRGRAPLVDRHTTRLERACRTLGVRAPRRSWGDTIASLAERNGLANGRARITVGDGVALVTCAALPAGLRAERRDGVTLALVTQPRAAAELKSTSWLPIWWSEQMVGGEALLCSARGDALETTRANFFVVTGRGIRGAAPPDVLPGVARDLLLELANELGVSVDSRPPRLRDRAGWREAFLTNAVRGVRPVRAIDELTLPVPGPDSLTRRLQAALDRRMGL